MRRFVIVMALLAACGGAADPVSTPTPPTPPVVLRLRLSPGSAALRAGDQLAMAAEWVDQNGNATGAALPARWSSSNPTTATVDSAGRVLALTPGSATVTVTVGSSTAASALSVTHGPPRALALARPAVGAINGGPFATPPVIQVRDVMGNLASTDNSTVVTVAASGGTLLGATSRTAAGGVVTFSDLGVRGTTGAAVTLVFSSGALPQLAQAPVTIAPFSFGNGTRLVVSEVPAGVYRSVNPASALCYWARLRDLTGATGSIIANDLGGGPRLLEVVATDRAVESSGCAPWAEVVGPVTSSRTAPFGDGTYLVGVDIEPGTWRSDGGDTGCYWERLRNVRGQDDIIANRFGPAPAIVTVLATDLAFSVSRCGTWTRVP